MIFLEQLLSVLHLLAKLFFGGDLLEQIIAMLYYRYPAPSHPVNLE